MQVAEPELKEITLTKEAAKAQTREDQMRRKAEMAAEEHDSDNEVYVWYFEDGGVVL